jgi:DNA polymerase-3 subunit gamma/tau
VRDALSLCDQIISYVGDATITEAHVAEVLGVADRSLTRTLVRALASGDAGAALGAVESAIERGVDEVQLARAIVRYLRDLAVLQVAPDRAELVDASDEERAELVSEAGQLDRSRVQQMFDRMLRCCDELGKTLQPRLVLDCALIDVATIEPLVPLGDLIDRLGDLEARVAGKGGARPAPSPSGGGGGGARPPSRPTSTTVPQSPSSKNAPRAVSPAASVDAAPQALSSSTASTPVPAPIPASDPGAKSAPTSMQPSGPVPKAPMGDSVASGSGPQQIALPANPAEALQAWAKVIDYLETQRKISLRGYFEFARVLKWTATDLELGFAADDDSKWAGENASEQANINELRGLLADLGHKVKVSVRMLDAAESKELPVRSIVESSRENKSAERSKREKEAREHPITKHVLQTFGASIKEIKTDV